MNNPKLLIVDDDPDIRYGLAIRLRANNYDVVMATDIMSASSIALREMPDLILLDLGLPGGDEAFVNNADGFLVIESLRAIAMPPIPVVIVSGRDSVTYQERARRLGATHFLQKPVDNDQLLAAIENALRGGEASGSTKQSEQGLGMIPRWSEDFYADPSASKEVCTMNNI